MEGCTLNNYKLMQFALGYKKVDLLCFSSEKISEVMFF